MDRLTRATLARSRRLRTWHSLSVLRDIRAEPMNSASASTAAFDRSADASSNGSSNGTTTPKNFSPLVRQFLDYLKLERHFSDYTVKSYGADLIQFGQFIAGEIGHANAAS